MFRLRLSLAFAVLVARVCVQAGFVYWGSNRVNDHAQHCASDGVLLPTVSNAPGTTPAAIHDYFVKFLKSVHARYTYVYEWQNGQWLIAHYHSSAMPEAVAGKGT